MHLSAKASRKLINIATIICGVLIVLLVIYWYRLGIFTDQAKMRAYLADKKIIGPIVFVLIQIVQVVIPIIPGGVSLLGAWSSSAQLLALSIIMSGFVLDRLLTSFWLDIMVVRLFCILFRKKRSINI